MRNRLADAWKRERRALSVAKRLSFSSFISFIVGVIAGCVCAFFFSGAASWGFGTLVFFGTEGILLLLSLHYSVVDEAESTQKVVQAAHAISQNGELNDNLVALIGYYEKVAECPLFREAFDDSLSRLVRSAANMANGHVLRLPMEPTNADYMWPLFKSTTKNTLVFATATSNDLVEWWSSPQGREYDKYNRRAVNQGAHVTRIFITNTRPKDIDVEAIILEQKDYGVFVKWIDEHQLPDKTQPSNIIGFLQLDGHPDCVVWIEGGYGKEIAYWNMSVDPGRVHDLHKHFQRVDELASSFE